MVNNQTIPLEMSSSIIRLREAVPRMNAAADRAVKTVNRVEKLLNEELGVGTRANVTIYSYQSDQYGYCEFKSLSYQRHNGRYRIVVVNGIEEADPDDWSTKPVSECDRDTKLQAIEKLGELIDAVTVAVERRVEKLADVYEKLDETVRAIDS